MYVCVCMHVCAYVCVYVHVHMHMYTYVHLMPCVQVEEIVEVGSLEPDLVHLPSLYVQRVVKGETYEKRIEVCVVSAYMFVWIQYTYTYRI